MKTIVVYDSKFGNTQKVAEAIRQGLSSDAEIYHIKDLPLDILKNVELLVVGSPTHGGQATEAIRNLLTKVKELDLYGLKTAVFDTGIPPEGQSWFMKLVIRVIKYAAPRMAKSLANSGVKILGAETFFVTGNEGPIQDGELERAKNWASEILTKFSE